MGKILMDFIAFFANVLRGVFGENGIWIFLALAGVVFVGTLWVLGSRTSRFRSKADNLIEAARRGQLDVAEGLLKAGVDANARDMTFGMTALKYARKKKNRKMEEFLVRYGARDDAR